MKYNTSEPVDKNSDPVELISNKEFGTAVSHTAPKIVGGYALVNSENMTKSTVVRSNEVQNVIVFYYTELQYTVEYKIAGNEGGVLSNTIEVKNSSDGFSGSVPTPNEGYRFIGWYLDAECSVPADERASINGTALVPDVGKLEPVPKTNIFYAKFELLTADLTIKRTNAADEGNGEQVFVYKITDNAAPSKIYYVSIKPKNGEGSVTLYDMPCVRYTVEQVNGWSWRCSDPAQDVNLTEDKTLVFSRVSDSDKWLNANSDVTVNKRS